MLEEKTFRSWISLSLQMLHILNGLSFSALNVHVYVWESACRAMPLQLKCVYSMGYQTRLWGGKWRERERARERNPSKATKFIRFHISNDTLSYRTVLHTIAEYIVQLMNATSMKRKKCAFPVNATECFWMNVVCKWNVIFGGNSANY